jgi:hypothetical protein
MKSSNIFLISIIIGGIAFGAVVSSKSFDFNKLEERIERVFLKYFNASHQTGVKKFLDYISKNIEFNHNKNDNTDDHTNEHHENYNSEEMIEMKKKCFQDSLIAFKDLSTIENKTDFNLVNSFIIASLDECSNVEALKLNNISNVFFDEKRKTSNFFIIFIFF